MWDFGGYAVPKIPRAFLNSVVGYIFLYVTTAELVSSKLLFLLPFFLSGPSFLSIACSRRIRILCKWITLEILLNFLFFLFKKSFIFLTFEPFYLVAEFLGKQQASISFRLIF